MKLVVLLVLLSIGVCSVAQQKTADFKAKHDGLKFLVNDPIPRFAVTVDGQAVLKAVLADVQAAEEAAWRDPTHEDRKKVAGESELARRDRQAAEIGQRVKQAESVTRANMASVLNWRMHYSTAEGLRPMPVESVIEDKKSGKFTILAPREFRNAALGAYANTVSDVNVPAGKKGWTRVPYSAPLIVSFVEGKTTYTNMTEAWEPSADEPQYTGVTLKDRITFKASAKDVDEQKLIPYDNTAEDADPEKVKVQQAEVSSKQIGPRNPLQAFLHLHGYEEVNTLFRLSTNWRDAATQIKVQNDTLAKAAWMPLGGHTVGLSYSELITNQAFADVYGLLGTGARLYILPGKPQRATSSFRLSNRLGQAYSVNSKLAPQATLAPGDVPLAYHSLDELRDKFGNVDASFELGGRLRGNPDVHGPDSDSGIARFRIKAQSPRFALSDRFFLQAYTTVYALPWKRYSASKHDNVWESRYEIAVLFKSGDDSGLKVAYGGGANPAQAFDKEKPSFSFGVTGKL